MMSHEKWCSEGHTMLAGVNELSVFFAHLVSDLKVKNAFVTVLYHGTHHL
jgi:hypothetical protein